MVYSREVASHEQYFRRAIPTLGRFNTRFAAGVEPYRSRNFPTLALFGPQRPPKIFHSFCVSALLLLTHPVSATDLKMAPKLSEDEIDDLLYAARTGDKDELTTLLSSLAGREKTSPADVLANAKDEGKSTCLHMATGNGHIGEQLYPISRALAASHTHSGTLQP